MKLVRSHDGRIDNRKPVRAAVDFGIHTVRQHEERVRMAEIHAGDDRDRQSEFTPDHSKHCVVVSLCSAIES